MLDLGWRAVDRFRSDGPPTWTLTSSLSYGHGVPHSSPAGIRCRPPHQIQSVLVTPAGVARLPRSHKSRILPTRLVDGFPLIPHTSCWAAPPGTGGKLPASHTEDRRHQLQP
eukprot:gene10558-biopygen4366